jgi:hypothetical protein
MFTRRAHFAPWSGLRRLVSLPQFAWAVKSVKARVWAKIGTCTLPLATTNQWVHVAVTLAGFAAEGGIGEWTHFAQAEKLWAYLETEMAKISNQPADPAGPGGQTTWRFCLVEPGDGETERGFASLEALLAHLRRELETG